MLLRPRRGADVWRLTELKCQCVQRFISQALFWNALASSSLRTWRCCSSLTVLPILPCRQLPMEGFSSTVLVPPLNICEGELNLGINFLLFPGSMRLSWSWKTFFDPKTLDSPWGWNQGTGARRFNALCFSDYVHLLARGSGKQRLSYLPLSTWTCSVS